MSTSWGRHGLVRETISCKKEVQKTMNDDLVYIEGDLEQHQREQLLSLIRRAEQTGSFQATPDPLGPTWVIVIGWGSGDTGPVSISRFRSQFTVTAPDTKAAVRKLEHWLDENEP
jgi:hypothetical protein